MFTDDLQQQETLCDSNILLSIQRRKRSDVIQASSEELENQCNIEILGRRELLSSRDIEIPPEQPTLAN